MTVFSFATKLHSNKFLVGNEAYDPSTMELIATVTAAGGETSLSFTSIPGTYSSLQIRGIAKDTATGTTAANLYVFFNDDTTTANYAVHALRGNGSAASASGSTSYGAVSIPEACTRSDAGYANMFGAMIVDLHDYASTTRNKTVRSFGAVDTNNTNGVISLASGLWLSTSAITKVKIQASVTAFAAGSVFKLYGLRSS